MSASSSASTSSAPSSSASASSPSLASSPVDDAKLNDVSDPRIREKYQKSSEIVNAALAHAAAQCVADKKIFDICSSTDKLILDHTSKLYTKDKKVEKGISFPCCCSVGNVVGHFSPSVADTTQLKEGDLVKIDLGVHVDGYVAVGATTVRVPPTATNAHDAKINKLVHATHVALDCCQRLIRVGNSNGVVTDMIGKVCADFGVTAVQGVLSHEMKRFVIDGDKVIINRADPEHKVEEVKFGANEIYAVDIVLSTGEGKPKATEERATIFKRNAQTQYQLKQQVSREFFAIVQQKYPTFPFVMRDFESEAKAKMGIRECLQHELISSYPVLNEKDGEFVAQVKATFLVNEKGTVRLTGTEFDKKMFPSDFKVSNEDVKKCLNSSTSIGANKKKKEKDNKENNTNNKEKEKGKEKASDVGAAAEKK